MLALAGCEGTFSNDLATDAPADPAVTQVQVALLGVEFETADGSTHELKFTDPETVDLLDLADTPLRMFTTEQLPADQYTGVRLLFDDQVDTTVVNSTSGEFPLVLQAGSFATVDFTVTDNRRSQDDVTVALDLRQSLSFDDADQQYTLKPALRAVSTSDSAQISGTVTATCPTGSSLSQGGAVYLYAGADVTPDDLDAIDAEPYATTRVVGTTGGSSFTYALRFLAPGRYTLALTCEGDVDQLGASDDLGFQDVQNVRVDSGETLTIDLD